MSNATRRRRDARQRLDALHGVARQLCHTGGVFVSRAGERGLHREHVLRIEARIDDAWRDERTDEQRRADEQYHRQPISVTTCSPRDLFWRMLVPEREVLSLSVALRSGRDALSAGISPNRTPVSCETTSV